MGCLHVAALWRNAALLTSRARILSPDVGIDPPAVVKLSDSNGLINIDFQ